MKFRLRGLIYLELGLVEVWTSSRSLAEIGGPKLGNWAFKEPKPGIESNPRGEKEGTGKSVTKFAHLGRHDQPRTTPKITASQRGIASIVRSINASQIVGRSKIANKIEARVIASESEIWIPQTPPSKKPLEFNRGWRIGVELKPRIEGFQWGGGRRRTSSY